jgi:hypothetical protein
MARRLSVLSASAICLVLVLGGYAFGQWAQRAVNVNGQWLGAAELAAADDAAGFELPDGFYWYDQRTCLWGIMGDQRPRGRVPCGGSQPRPGGGMGSLFTPPICDAHGCNAPDH